jgi:hypothetical protein
MLIQWIKLLRRVQRDKTGSPFLWHGDGRRYLRVWHRYSQDALRALNQTTSVQTVRFGYSDIGNVAGRYVQLSGACKATVDGCGTFGAMAFCKL